MTNITPSDLKKLAKKKGVKRIDRLSSREYNDLVKTKQLKGSSDNFFFTYDVKPAKDGYVIVLKGRHYSNNSINSFSFKRKLAYKKAIHDAAKLFALKFRSFMKTVETLSHAEVYYIFYNPKSRDSDANGMTTKYFQDTLVSLGFIKDDNRDVLRRISPMDGETEVLSKVYKAECYLSMIKEG